MPASPERGPAVKACRIEGETDEDIDRQLVCLLSLHRVIGVVELGDLGSLKDQAAAQAPTTLPNPPRFADGHMMATEGRGSVAESGPGPDGGNELSRS